MKARVLRPAISFATVGAVIVAALAVYLLMGAGDTHADSRFQPTSQTKYCNALNSTYPDVDLAGTAALGTCGAAENLAAGATPNTTSILDIVNTDLNFSSVTTFTPNSTTISSVPVSAKVGGLHSETRLGLFNGPCFSFTPVDFIMYNVALPNVTTPGSIRTSTNIAWPRDDGVSARFDGWKIGNGSTPPGGAEELISTTDVLKNTPTANSAGSDLKADYNSRPFLNYPKYLLDTFDPDGAAGPADPILPVAAYGGLSYVVSSYVPLFFLQFDDTGIRALAGSGLDGAPSLFTANMGQPNVSVLNDPTATTVSASGITDFCSPLNVTTMLLGQALPQPSGAAVTRQTTGAAGTVFHLQHATSLRDADQDGYENAMDTCPRQVNASVVRPPTTGGDTDGDGIDNNCDTFADPPLTTDSDGDTLDNRQDICPNDSSAGNNTEDEVPVTNPEPADLGTRGDSIGNPCDTGGLIGAVSQNGHTFSLTFSSTVANGRYHAVSNVMAKCIGLTDADGDGYCAGATDANDSGPFAATRHGAWTSTNPGRQIDTDGDKVPDGVETYLGTDATKACAQDGTANNESPLDNWPLDIRADNGTATTLDLTDFATALNQPVGANAEATARIDFNVDGNISSLDLTGYAATLNRGCGAIGTPVSPPDGPIPAWVQQ